MSFGCHYFRKQCTKEHECKFNFENTIDMIMQLALPISLSFPHKQKTIAGKCHKEVSYLNDTSLIT